MTIIKQTEIQKLEDSLKEKRTDIWKLEQSLNDLKLQKELPSLKKNFENKYFKVENCYSSGQNWYIYFHVKEVTSLSECNCERFETTIDSRIGVEQNSIYWVSELQGKEISKKEYMKELKKLKSRVQKIGE